MRKSRFRAWDNTPKKIGGQRMLSWDELLQYEIEFGEDFFVSKIVSGEQKDLIPMQYTGLKDKNGKEIYEGDICRIDTSEAHPPYGENGIAVRAVEWWNGQFVFHAARYDYMGESDDYINFGWWIRSNEHKPQLKQVEVIGDIYQNPDLIEKEK